MKVGFGFAGSCSVVRRTSPLRLRFGRRAIALSRVCITRTMIVRRDQPFGRMILAKSTRVADDLAEQLQRPRQFRPVSDQQRVEGAHRVAVVAVGDGLDVGVGVGIDARGDRNPFGQVVRVVLGDGDREDHLAVGADQLAEPVGDPRQGAAEAAALHQLVGAERAGGEDHAAGGDGAAAAAGEEAGALARDRVALGAVGGRRAAGPRSRCVRPRPWRRGARPARGSS